MRVLLSIKPEYVDKIFKGEKKYEYRKSLFKRTDVDTIIIYSTKPVGKVVGEFKIDSIIEDNPIKLWEKTKSNAGILKKDYLKYFDNKKKGFAIVIKDVCKYDIPLDLLEFDEKIKVAPQSFRYII